MTLDVIEKLKLKFKCLELADDCRPSSVAVLDGPVDAFDGRDTFGRHVHTLVDDSELGAVPDEY